MKLNVDRYFLLIIIAFLLAGCSPSDDDGTSVIFSMYAEGAMSAGIFEVKTDSTFRYWKGSLFKNEEINGTWTISNDTFDLFVSDHNERKIGRLYIQKRYYNGLPHYKPQFKCLDNNSILFDLTYSNARLMLRCHVPPQNIDFGIRRSKPKK